MLGRRLQQPVPSPKIGAHAPQPRKTVQRYEVVSNDPFDMEPRQDGAWVYFEDAAAAQREMNWVDEAPTVDGYYWLQRDDNEPIIVKVWDAASGVVDCGAMVSFTGSDWDRDVLEVTRESQCRWIGPLKEPPSTASASSAKPPAQP